jgi:peptidoglycan hydrolase CwlO-like protein
MVLSNEIDINELIKTGISAIAMIVGVTTFILAQVRNGKTDIKEDEKELSEMRSGIFKANMKLDQVCATTNETRADIKAMNKTLAEHGEEIAVIKRDLKTAFNRIDEVREYVKSREEREAKA